MRTVPNAKLSQAKTWIVRPSNFPFGVSRDTLGIVTGDTRERAQQRATELYGRHVIVELQHSPSNGTEHSRIGRANDTPPPARATLTTALQPRAMTADEAQMARAAACCRTLVPLSRDLRALVKTLHARTFTANRTISEPEAKQLRAAVRVLATFLDESVVAMAGAES